MIFFAIGINAQNYSVALIPDSLKENAHCVIREFMQETEVKTLNTGIEKYRTVITVLDKQGEDDANLIIYYNVDMEVSINQIILYDATGKIIRKVKQSEIGDYPAYSGLAMFADTRIKAFDPDYAEYPFTIAYDYVEKSANVISYGSWRPMDDYNISVQHAQLTLICPDNIRINIKEVNDPGKRAEFSAKNSTITKWVLDNVKAVKDEPFDIGIRERTPAVYLMPNELIFANYKGVAKNWEEYGGWLSKLYEGRDALPDTLKVKVNELIKDHPDTLERIKILYTYMQENTRYVAVFLGIGGLQPFSAQTVFETGYGDCKALSNYMHALLKYIGIKSYPAVVSSGQYIEPIFNDFPNFQQFDHVILCVPRTNDTLWLECTSQKMPFGFIGDFTDDRDVLLLTENGGKFAHTKKYSGTDNYRTCKAYFTIDPTATAAGSIKTIYQGLQYDNIAKLLYANTKDQKEWLYDHSSLPSLQISDFSIADDKKIIPVASVQETVISRNYGTFTGNYMLLPLNMINNQKPIQKMLKPRGSDILISRSFTDYDTLVYQIPDNYKLETLPTGKSIQSNYGTYASSVSINGNKITYTRKFVIHQGRYQPSAYKDFYEFILAVSKADNEKAILTKKI